MLNEFMKYASTWLLSNAVEHAARARPDFVLCGSADEKTINSAQAAREKKSLENASKQLQHNYSTIAMRTEGAFSTT